MISILLRILLVLIVGYLGIVLFLYLKQDKIVYYPFKKMEQLPSDLQLHYSDVYFKSSDGLNLNGWIVGDENLSKVVLFCHGNGGNISYNLHFPSIYNKLGFRVFLFDYRGYGKSEGIPTEEGTYRDVEAAWYYLTQTLGISPANIIILGHSLGGAIAARLTFTLEIKPRALILESTFTSVPDLGANLYPFLPVRLVSKYHYDTSSILPMVHLPVLVIHSREDEIIPFSHGQKLFHLANQPKRFLEISGTHNEGTYTSGLTYTEGVKEFLNSLGMD